MIFKKILRSFFANTTRPLQVFLGLLLLFSGGYLFFEMFFSPFAQKTLYPLFAFSYKGLKEQKWWQFLTFFWIDSPEKNISFGFLFSFFMKFYVLRFVAISITQIKGFFSFCILYVFSALAGLLFLLPILPFSLSFTGFVGPIYAIALAWIMLHCNSRFFLFFRVPFKAVSVFGWVFFSSLILDFFDEKYLEILFYTGCTLFGYLYALLKWGCLGPFPRMHKWEKKILSYTYFLRKRKSKCQIYDIGSSGGNS